MKLLVCIKQVADSESPFTVSDDGSFLEFGGHAAYRINRYDEYAIEEALSISEKYPDTIVEVLSIGPDRVRDSIRRALSMGAREGYHIQSGISGNIEPGTKARMIAHFAWERTYDLILMGVMSEDFGNCEVGPLTAEIMGIPCATHVIRLEADTDTESIYAEREVDGSLRHAVRLTLPAVITVQSGINHPRYPSLSNVLRAKSSHIPSFASGISETPKEVETQRRLFVPGEVRRGDVLQGSSADMAEELWQFLHVKSLL